MGLRGRGTEPRRGRSEGPGERHPAGSAARFRQRDRAGGSGAVPARAGPGSRGTAQGGVSRAGDRQGPGTGRGAVPGRCGAAGPRGPCGGRGRRSPGLGCQSLGRCGAGPPRRPGRSRPVAGPGTAGGCGDRGACGPQCRGRGPVRNFKPPCRAARCHTWRGGGASTPARGRPCPERCGAQGDSQRHRCAAAGFCSPAPTSAGQAAPRPFRRPGPARRGCAREHPLRPRPARGTGGCGLRARCRRCPSSALAAGRPAAARAWSERPPPPPPPPPSSSPGAERAPLPGAGARALARGRACVCDSPRAAPHRAAQRCRPRSAEPCGPSPGGSGLPPRPLPRAVPGAEPPPSPPARSLSGLGWLRTAPPRGQGWPHGTPGAAVLGAARRPAGPRLPDYSSRQPPRRRLALALTLRLPLPVSPPPPPNRRSQRPVSDPPPRAGAAPARRPPPPARLGKQVRARPPPPRRPAPDARPPLPGHPGPARPRTHRRRGGGRERAVRPPHPAGRGSPWKRSRDIPRG